MPVQPCKGSDDWPPPMCTRCQRRAAITWKGHCRSCWHGACEWHLLWGSYCHRPATRTINGASGTRPVGFCEQHYQHTFGQEGTVDECA